MGLMAYYRSGLANTHRRMIRIGAEAPEIELDEMIAESDFNCTKYPGICKPTSWAMLRRVMEFQYQLNRIAHVRNLPKIAVDGDIGPLTHALFVQIIGNTSAYPTARSVAMDLINLLRQMKALADALGAPTSIDVPAPTKPPSFISPSGDEVIPPADTPGPVMSPTVAPSEGSPGKKIALGLASALGLLILVAKH